jgi:hypothetical protein
VLIALNTINGLIYVRSSAFYRNFIGFLSVVPQAFFISLTHTRWAVTVKLFHQYTLTH